MLHNEISYEDLGCLGQEDPEMEQDSFGCDREPKNGELVGLSTP